MNLRKVYDFATTTPLDEIRFILETKRLNKAAAERSFKGNYGHELGKILKSSKSEEQILGSNTFTHILSYTSAACDARMAGAMIPVMSNSGSGNQGITATLPVVVYAEDNHKSEEELIRALTLSHLTAIYIKQAGTSVCTMRLCSGCNRFQLWYHLFDGRHLRANHFCRTEYDR